MVVLRLKENSHAFRFSRGHEHNDFVSVLANKSENNLKSSSTDAVSGVEVLGRVSDGERTADFRI